MPHGSGHHHHGHHDHHDAADAHDSARRIGWAFWLNLIFACFELLGGLYIHSLAVVSDALHDFGDALSLGVGYFLQSKSAQGPSESYSYGLRRLSLLSAFLTGVVISVGAVYVVVQGLLGLQHPGEPQAKGMMLFAVVGIAVNGFAAWKLGHGHSHGHGQNHNERMMRWHLLEDLMGWVAVLIGGYGIYLFEWTWLDPVLAIAISVFVLYNVIRRLGETITLFLQGNPNPLGLRHFRDHITALTEIKGVHDVHFWSLDGVSHVLSLHIVLHDLTTAATVKEKIRKFSHELGKVHLTIEVESTQEHCHDDCEHP
jgi:cobalt-zinc-cadmium efflux system protein